MDFVALDHASDADRQTAPAHWYIVRQGEILTVGPGTVPLVLSAAEAVGAAVEPDTDPIFIGRLDGVSCWAVGVPEGTEVPDRGRWEHLRALGASLPLTAWKAAARAVHLVDWARTSRFCGRCGTATVPSPGERAARCPNCGLTAYPRVAPAVIVLVHRQGPEGDQILLARNGGFRGRMFSVLAGFVEPGETLEDTVHREIGEEVSVRLHPPVYVASQPWPFPHSLMVGFTAEWAGGDIAVDGAEIVEAAWFGPDDLPDIPPRLSIARQLIDGWLAAH
jgi:NAD+ diphosphatase